MAHADRMYSTAHWKKLRLQILDRDGWRCHWCGVELPHDASRRAQVDHLTAVVDGGPRYAPANLVASCVRCNSARGAKTLARMAAAAGRFVDGERFGAIRP